MSDARTEILEALLDKARTLGASVARAAVDSGDLDRYVNELDEDPAELRSNLLHGTASDGLRVLRRWLDTMPDPVRAVLQPDDQPDDALLDQLADAWTAGYDDYMVRNGHPSSRGQA